MKPSLFPVSSFNVKINFTFDINLVNELIMAKVGKKVI